MARTTYYIFSSIDGFVAGEDDSLDWLAEIDLADRDLTPFLKEVGAYAMGSATYESVLTAEKLLEHPERWQEAHSGRPAWVFTSRDLPVVPGADITFVHGEVRPAHEAMARAAGDQRILIAGGGALATAFADAGLLDEMVIGVVPATLAAGKPLFTGRLTSSRLSLSNVKQVGQLAYLTYDLRPAS